MKKIVFVFPALIAFAAFASAADPFPLVVTTREYPHIEAIQSGTIQIPECTISYSTMSASQLTARLDLGAAGDVTEVDMATFLKKFSTEEKHDWLLVPVFPWREFPHHHVMEKNGKLGVDVANQTVLLWARGILASSPTFKPAESWNQAAVGTATATTPFFEHSITVEQDYFAQTRIFPIITALAVRRELAEANPWLPEAIFIAFSDAKAKALEAGTVPLPWGPVNRESTIQLMKKNYWSYGVRNNPKTLSALLKYAHEQDITTKELKVEDIFPPDALALIDEKGAKN
jgi:hypothetical protein